MIDELGRNLFWALLVECIVVILAIVFADDKRRMALVLVLGTIVAGMVGYGRVPIESFLDSLPSLEDIVPPISPRPLTTDYQTVSLQRWSELDAPETNLGLTPGRNYLLDVPFETGWTASTQCSHLTDQPESIQLDVNIPNPASVHLLLQAGWGLTKYAGKEIGYVNLGFSDGSSVGVPLTLGLNIRDWAWENPVAVNLATSSTLQPAWKGVAPDGTPGGMDMLTIDIPGNQSTLTSIRVTDVSQSTTGEVNPCIHLVAMTVKYSH